MSLLKVACELKYYTLLDVKKKKKLKCNGAQLEVHRGTVFLYIYPNQAPSPQKKKKTKQKQLRPIRIKIWTAKNSWIRILMRKAGEVKPHYKI